VRKFRQLQGLAARCAVADYGEQILDESIKNFFDAPEAIDKHGPGVYRVVEVAEGLHKMGRGEKVERLKEDSLG
jgi:hypothetical protein